MKVYSHKSHYIFVFHETLVYQQKLLTLIILSNFTWYERATVGNSLQESCGVRLWPQLN